MRARWLPAPLGGFIGAAGRGRVLAAFARSAYLEVRGEVVALAAAGLDRGPLVILVDGFDGGRLSPGDEVALAGGRLRVAAYDIALDGADPWDPTLPTPPAGAVSRLPDVERALARGAPPESAAALLGHPPAAVSARHRRLLDSLCAGLAVLEDTLRGLDACGDLAAAVGHIAGRGPGLTPSGDDVLVGVLHAMTAWPALAAAAGGPEVRRRIARAASPLTTRISAAYLRAASEGWAAEPWHTLVGALDGTDEALGAAVAALLRVGETSGADALTGFCWAARRLGA
ncbi:MAG: DUF2877 domain-containing protein [Armatimonadota bacterium]|nr:DUF2877 domain-containing protein [Armatimonadota bacterium]